MLRDIEDGKHLLRSPRREQQTRREHKAAQEVGVDNVDNVSRLLKNEIIRWKTSGNYLSDNSWLWVGQNNKRLRPEAAGRGKGVPSSASQSQAGQQAHAICLCTVE